MKKLFLSILVICSLLGGNAYAKEDRSNKNIYVQEILAEGEDGHWFYKFLKDGNNLDDVMKPQKL